jgi:hypothetical protein
MISPENVVWAFYSDRHRQFERDNAELAGKALPNDTFYKDFSSQWVLVTAVFDCIDNARRNYKYGDVRYLGAVDRSTKVDVAFGQGYPLIPVVVAERPIRKKKSKSPAFSPNTTTVNRKSQTYNYFEDYSGLEFRKGSCFYDYYGDKIRIP